MLRPQHVESATTLNKYPSVTFADGSAETGELRRVFEENSRPRDRAVLDAEAKRIMEEFKHLRKR